MGNTQAKNTANAIVSAGISITNSAVDQCTSQAQQNVTFSCGGSSTTPANCPAGITPTSCDFSNITVGQLSQVNMSCFQNASANTTTNQQVAQSVTQTAAAVAAGLGLSGTEASNIVNASATVSDNISTTFSNILANSGNQSVGFYGSNCENQFTYIDVNQVNNSFQNGVQNASIVTSATENLSQTISQKATAVNLGLVGILIAIAVVIIAVGFFFKNVAGGAAKLLIPIGILVGAYLGVAYWQKFFPWSQKKPAPSNCSQAGTQSNCPTGQTCVSAGAGMDNNSYCVPECSTWQACPSGVCSSNGTCTACAASSDCPTAFPVCVSGTCYAACSPSNPCSGSYSCQSGACIPSTNACQTDVNCDPNYSCQKGQCVATAPGSLRSRNTPASRAQSTSPVRTHRPPHIMAK